MCFNRSKKNFGGWSWRSGRVGYGEKTHVKEVMEDRTVSARGNRVAEECAKHPSIDGLGQELKMTIDGMDQAKFKVPRNTASSADLEPLWRPQLHVCGVIVHGHMECYFIMDSDRAKDSNMNCTVMSRVLDLVREKSSRICVASEPHCRCRQYSKRGQTSVCCKFPLVPHDSGEI